MIGGQGSGKSTFYRETFLDTHVRIDLDMLRTRRREKLILEACIAGQQSSWSTIPIARADRARYIARARVAGFRMIAYFFSTPMSEALRLNNLRKGKQRVPPVAIAGTFENIQRPTLEEGFDEIHTVEG